MYLFDVLLASTILLGSSHAVAAPPRTNDPISLAPGSPHIPNLNTTNSLNFLGVNCYHLDPSTDRISLQMCQPLFAWLMSGGNVYEPQSFWNGWRFKRAGFDQCMITIFSPEQDDFAVRISYAKIVTSAHEVLEQCMTGGADTFEGNWSVVVTRNVVKNRVGERKVEERNRIVFGATGHIGRSVAKTALFHNDLVTAVGRNHENTIQSIQESLKSFSDHCLPLLCDVRIRTTVEAVIQQSIAHWGRIDIIANCTGYGVIGACEDQDDYDIRNQFETNFFGTVNILHTSLPYFQTRQRYQPHPPLTLRNHDLGDERQSQSTDDEQQPPGGRYLIFSSTSGALGVPGLGPYSATKHAVEGLIESMLYETHPFNIKATLIEPGHLRQDDVEDESVDNQHSGANPESTTRPFTHFLIKQPLPNSPYNTPTSPAAHPRRVLQWLSNSSSSSSTSQFNQPHLPTSTVRSAELVWQLGHCVYPPLRLLLGAFAVESVRDRMRCVIEEIEEWRWLGFGSGEEGEGEGQSRSREIKEERDDDDEVAGERFGEGDGDGDGEGGTEDQMEVNEKREKG
ncbi:MAG: hypothetical protein Q9166_005322 [cf. Caloplaca sp. 2 TL-2023]